MAAPCRGDTHRRQAARHNHRSEWGRSPRLARPRVADDPVDQPPLFGRRRRHDRRGGWLAAAEQRAPGWDEGGKAHGGCFHFNAASPPGSAMIWSRLHGEAAWLRPGKAAWLLLSFRYGEGAVDRSEESGVGKECVR